MFTGMGEAEARGAALKEVDALFARNRMDGGYIHGIFTASITEDPPALLDSRTYIDDRVGFTGKQKLYAVVNNLVAHLLDLEGEE